jgi:nitrite reductase (NADH) small subunit
MVKDPTSLVPICPVEEITRESGVTALVHGKAVAIFRTHAGEIYALSNYDPFSHASVLARGIVGTRTIAGAAVDFVASPMHKQAFDLRTGRCLDDASVCVATYDVVIADGMVLVGGAKGAG